MLNPNDFYVYVHRKKSDNTVFYVGKGCKDRAASHKGRNSRWVRTVKKHGLSVEIIFDGIRDWYAQELEIETIARYGRENLCNMTDGGDGTSGHVKSKETIEKFRAAVIGQKRSADTRQKMSVAATGRKMSLESVEKSAASRRGKKLSAEHVAKVALANRGKKRTDKQIKALSDSLKGKKKTPEWVEKVAKTKRKKVVCTTTGMVFDGIRVAAGWLSENGHPKASMKSIWKAANEPHRIAYGHKWAYLQDFEDRLAADRRNGKYRGG